MVKPLVLLRAGGSAYAVAVDAVGGVRRPEGLERLPGALPGVAGLLRDEARDELLPVLDALGPGDDVLVLAPPGGERFGVLVEAVRGVVRVAEEEIAAPPAGRGDPLVTGVCGGAARGALLLDVRVLGDALVPPPEAS